MSLSNLPDDWGAYRSRCSRCGGWNHDSGAEVCDCREEEADVLASVEGWLADASVAAGRSQWRQALERIEWAHCVIEEWLASSSRTMQ